MGPKKLSRHEKAAKRHAKATKRRQNQENSEDFEDDVPKMRFQLEKFGLVLKEVEGDGNCLFRALSDQLYGTPGKHVQLRQEVVDFMRKNRSDFEPFHSDDRISFESHLDLLARDGTYAENDALVAFARAHNVTIVIHQLNEPLWQIHGGREPNVKELHISYHNGDHYNSIRKKGHVQNGLVPDIKISVLNNSTQQEASEEENTTIWSEDGTGSRIFGPEVSKEATKGQKKVSSKAVRKKLDKRRAAQQGDEDIDAVPAMEALSL